MIPALLVTGDLVLDCHVYGGIDDSATWSTHGTTYAEYDGGAALTCQLLQRAAKVPMEEFDAQLKDWAHLNFLLEANKKEAKSLPNELESEKRPGHTFESQAILARAPPIAWTVHRDVEKQYTGRTADERASNISAARRITEHLALIDFKVLPRTSTENDSWKKSLDDAIAQDVEPVVLQENIWDGAPSGVLLDGHTPRRETTRSGIIPS